MASNEYQRQFDTEEVYLSRRQRKKKAREISLMYQEILDYQSGSYCPMTKKLCAEHRSPLLKELLKSNDPQKSLQSPNAVFMVEPSEDCIIEDVSSQIEAMSLSKVSSSSTPLEPMQNDIKKGASYLESDLDTLLMAYDPAPKDGNNNIENHMHYSN